MLPLERHSYAGLKLQTSKHLSNGAWPGFMEAFRGTQLAPTTMIRVRLPASIPYSSYPTAGGQAEQPCSTLIHAHYIPHTNDCGLPSITSVNAPFYRSVRCPKSSHHPLERRTRCRNCRWLACQARRWVLSEPSSLSRCQQGWR